MFQRPSILLGLALLAGSSFGQAAVEEQVPATEVKDAVQGGWSVPDLDRTKAIIVSDSEVLENSSKSQLDVLRVERNASLARNQGTIPALDQARLVDLAVDLNAASPQSFEAHMANYYVQFPAPEAFRELDLANAKGRDRDELIGPNLLNAARKDNTTELVACAKEMKLRGKVAPALYRVAEDIFASIEPSAVVFAAGEMDAYPLWVAQFAEDKRKDVLVVDERLLVDPAYRSSIWERSKARGNVPQADRFIADLPGATQRPVFLSLAVGQSTMAPLRERLYVTGLAMRLSATPIDNIPLLENRWDRFKKALDAGPLARNYLVPGAVLLTHYRAIGDEARASRLELELRDMAKKLGATNSLIKSGVLAH
ncbi:MAG TPA: hypothetical protein PLB89_08850 [Flavobacteriales bacterium]|nr:hypothetical protein [Flavobacteriales bacterium]